MPLAGLPQVAVTPGRVRGKCLDAAWLHYQCPEKTRQQCLGGRRTVSMLRLLPRPQLEHAQTCSTAEVWRGHNACVHAVVCGMKLADPGITTEPRGLTTSQPPLLSPDAVRPWMCVWPPPLQRQLAETPHRRHLIANSLITEMKLWNCGTRAFTIALLFGQRMDDRTRP